MAPPSSLPRRTYLVELPTFTVAIAIHALWLTLTAHAATLPWWFVAPLGGLLVAWHGSFQHETIHGHPTRWRTINALFGSMPLGLWLPYGIYREQHEAHHRTPHLTDPLDDPESFYVSKETWAEMSLVRRAFLQVNSTVLGRLLFGPSMVVAQFALGEVRLLLKGEFPRRRLLAWLWHFVGVAVVIAWLRLVCHVSLVEYVIAFVYPGLALTLLRSFIEHRPALIPDHRVGIVEAGRLWSLLYLNNNLHVVHHEAPWVPWYELPALYRARRREVLEGNGGFVFPGYLSVLARFAFRAKDSPVHPW